MLTLARDFELPALEERVRHAVGAGWVPRIARRWFEVKVVVVGNMFYIFACGGLVFEIQPLSC